MPVIWMSTPDLRVERKRSPAQLHLVMHRSILGIGSTRTLIAFAHQVPMADLLGGARTQTLARWRAQSPDARSVELIGWWPTVATSADLGARDTAKRRTGGSPTAGARCGLGFIHKRT